MPAAAVFGSARIHEHDPEYAVAMRMGALLAQEGWTVMTGGYAGAMEAASRGAHEAGGHVVGVTVAAWVDNTANRWVTEERRAANLVARLDVLMAADAAIAVGGGMGTLAEVALAWNLRQKAPRHPGPLILVGPQWEQVIPHLAEHLVIDPHEIEIAQRVADPDGAMQCLHRLG
jgi:uncharacterized protein (TIGR00725 family)